MFTTFSLSFDFVKANTSRRILFSKSDVCFRKPQLQFRPSVVPGFDVEIVQVHVVSVTVPTEVQRHNDTLVTTTKCWS